MELFKRYDLIEFAGDYFQVLKNYGTCGRVQEYFPSGNVGTIIDPFYWEFEGEKCKKVTEEEIHRS